MRHRFRARRTSHIHAGQITLNDLPAGQSGIVRALDGEKELVNRIVSFGFSIGTQVTVLNNQGQGPIVVSVQGAHFALGRQEADLIQIQLL
jgi:Fe2+ transport system protein FeoA